MSNAQIKTVNAANRGMHCSKEEIKFHSPDIFIFRNIIRINRCVRFTAGYQKKQDDQQISC